MPERTGAVSRPFKGYRQALLWNKLFCMGQFPRFPDIIISFLSVLKTHVSLFPTCFFWLTILFLDPERVMKKKNLSTYVHTYVDPQLKASRD